MITTLYEPFRHWSEGGSVYILSDLHFADSDCKLMDPNWITPEEQIEIINIMVGKGDTFVCLGDGIDKVSCLFFYKIVDSFTLSNRALYFSFSDARQARK